MATYLFAWNPRLWNWPSLPRDRARLARQEFIDIRWASGRTRQIEPGSRAFLVRLGVPPKGLFGDGYTMTAPVEGTHWRDDKRAQGIQALYLRIRLNSLYDHPVVTFDELAEPPFSRYRWGVRQSGARVPANIADALEVLWERNVAALAPTAAPAVKGRMERASAVATDIDAYIAAAASVARPLLQQVRETIARAAPGAEETISYRIPAFRLHGVLVYLAAFKSHIGFYPPVRGDARLEKAVARYAGEKGNLRFPLDEPMPLALIERIVKLRVKQNLAKGKS